MQTALPLPGLCKHEACLSSLVGFQALSSIPIHIKVVYLSCCVYSRTTLGDPGEGIRAALNCMGGNVRVLGSSVFNK